MKKATYRHFCKQLGGYYQGITEDLKLGLLSPDEARKMIEWTDEQKAMLDKIKEFEGLE